MRRLPLPRASRRAKTNKQDRTKFMKTYNWVRTSAIVLAIVALMTVVVLKERPVQAAPTGSSITGTVKLEGTAPHQKPIDMSKEPSCAAVHKASPVTTETVVA